MLNKPILNICLKLKVNFHLCLTYLSHQNNLMVYLFIKYQILNSTLEERMHNG